MRFIILFSFFFFVCDDLYFARIARVTYQNKEKKRKQKKKRNINIHEVANVCVRSVIIIASLKRERERSQSVGFSFRESDRPLGGRTPGNVNVYRT